MKEALFQEFAEVSAKQWKQKIQFDLKGADYNQSLIYDSLDGIQVNPFYHSEHLKKTPSLNSPKNWEICEKIYVEDCDAALEKAFRVLEKGAESIWFIIPSEKVEIENLLEKIAEKQVPVYLKLNFLSEDFFKRLRKQIEKTPLVIYLQTDIIGKLARSGNWFQDMDSDHKILDEILENSAGFESVVSVDMALYHNSGANIPQQLAYGLAQVNEYLNHINSEEKFQQIRQEFKPQFLVAQGANYFFEIAKIRALRWLYASLAREYKLPESCHILSSPGKRNKTLYDYNVNLLRSTTESMSAVLGGADAVNNLAYDSFFHKSNEFGDRIARNQLLVMKHEAYLDKVSNAAEGTYYIEELTRQFAEKALEIFKQIEAGGGFLKLLKKGSIQQQIKDSAKKEQKLFDSGELVLIGTNKYENNQDQMNAELELYPFVKKKQRKTLVEPILEKRLSESLEKERLEQEKAGKKEKQQ